MSTKSLQRTVIEGGRTGYYKAEVAQYQREERAATREFVRAATVDPESFDEVFAPIRKPSDPSFADKIRPTVRFLSANVGRPWSKVRSELFAKFDTRTTPGRHVLFDHILKDVQETKHPQFGWDWGRFFVDPHGILRENKTRYPRNRNRRPLETIDQKKVVAWLGCRQIARAGDRFVWMYSDVPNVKAVWSEREHKGPDGRIFRFRDFCYARVDSSGNVMTHTTPWSVLDYRGKPRYRYSFEAPIAEMVVSRSGWRRGRLLDKTDEQYFRSLPERVQRILLGEPY